MRMDYRSSFGSMAAKPPIAGARQRIGLLGGSFNPPHAAHLLISEIALRRLQLDRLWWVVTPGNPLKAGRALMPLRQRLAAARTLAINPRITITGFEQHLASPYTSATLEFLALRYPQTDFVWVMGADCLAEFHRWHRWQHIFESMPVAVVDRPGWRMPAVASVAAQRYARARVDEAKALTLAARAAPAWTLLTGPLSPLSSTQVRGDGGKQPDFRLPAVKTAQKLENIQ